MHHPHPPPSHPHPMPHPSYPQYDSSDAPRNRVQPTDHKSYEHHHGYDEYQQQQQQPYDQQYQYPPHQQQYAYDPQQQQHVAYAIDPYEAYSQQSHPAVSSSASLDQTSSSFAHTVPMQASYPYQQQQNGYTAAYDMTQPLPQQHPMSPSHHQLQHPHHQHIAQPNPYDPMQYLNAQAAASAASPHSPHPQPQHAQYYDPTAPAQPHPQAYSHDSAYWQAAGTQQQQNDGLQPFLTPPPPVHPSAAATGVAPLSPSGSIATTAATSTTATTHTLDPSFDAEAEYLFLTKLERKISGLSRKGHLLYALELMEESIRSRTALYGVQSAEVHESAEKLALLYNSLAMTSLYKSEYKQSLKLLRKSESLTSQHSPFLLAIRIQTLNNLACVYRRLERPKTALNLLRECLVLVNTEGVKTSGSASSIASNTSSHNSGRHLTHLNICAILSQLNRHHEAIEHAKAAVMYCQKMLLEVGEDDEKKRSTESKQKYPHEEEKERMSHDMSQDSLLSSFSTSSLNTTTTANTTTTSATSAASAQQQQQKMTEKLILLAIAYHNLGVEEEFLFTQSATNPSASSHSSSSSSLNSKPTCLSWYQKAYSLASEYLGEKEAITITFKESLEQARVQVERLWRERKGIKPNSRPTSATVRRTSSRPASATVRTTASPSATRSSSIPRTRPASATVRSSAHQVYQAQHSLHSKESEFSSTTTADMNRSYSNSSSAAIIPSYSQSTQAASGRVRPKSASVSRPPRPR